MSKKFRKALFLTAAVGSAAGALLYFARKKLSLPDEHEEDYDDFSDDAEKDSDSSRSYVPLNSDTTEQTVTEEPSSDTPETDSFTPLAEQVAEEKAEETVEEFFDEEDSSEEEPPITES